MQRIDFDFAPSNRNVKAIAHTACCETAPQTILSAGCGAHWREDPYSEINQLRGLYPGVKIVGVDNDDDLEETAGNDVVVLKMDFNELDADVLGSFDLITCIATGLNTLRPCKAMAFHENAGNLDTISSLMGLLEPGGALALHESTSFHVDVAMCLLDVMSAGSHMEEMWIHDDVLDDLAAEQDCRLLTVYGPVDWSLNYSHADLGFANDCKQDVEEALGTAYHAGVISEAERSYGLSHLQEIADRVQGTIPVMAPAFMFAYKAQ